MFSCKFSEISKNTVFTEHLQTAASAFSFSEAATGGAYVKGVLEDLAKFTEKHLYFAKFSRKPFLQNTSATSLLKWGTAKSGWKTLNENYLETLTLKVPFSYIITFSTA